MSRKDIRRQNLLALLRQHETDTAFAQECGLVPAHVSQMKNGHRNVGDDVAERIEHVKNLPAGWLDQPHAAEEPVPYNARPRLHPIPVVGTAQLGPDGLWLELDYPVGTGDGFIEYPSRDPNSYALRCKGDSMRPRIKPGEFVIVEPNQAYGPGDEVVAKDRRGRVMVKVFNFQRNGQIELGSVNEDHKPVTLDLNDVEYIHYVAAICKASMYYEAIA